MRLKLAPHPFGRPGDIAVEAEAIRPRSDRLRLEFVVSGDVGSLRMPAPTPPGRADDLWKHTCFEAFLRSAADPGYWEFNFAPSGQWAAYRFSDYREGMVAAREVPAPAIETRVEADRLELSVELELERELGLLADLAWQIGLSAVIEASDGAISHWALSHTPDAPDFHHRDCFALELPPPERG